MIVLKKREKIKSLRGFGAIFEKKNIKVGGNDYVVVYFVQKSFFFQYILIKAYLFSRWLGL